MTVFLLGPNEWRATPLSVPRWVQDYLPATWNPREATISPLDLRVALAECCRRSGHRAVVMEAYPRGRGERHIAMFARIEREMDVRQHFVVWPPGCKRSGLDVELGNLLTRMERGEDLDVRVFPHIDAAGVVSGEFVSKERGSRSRYYSDLYEYGALVVPWVSMEELFDFVIHAAGTLR